MLDYEERANSHFLSIINLRVNKQWLKHVINIPRQKVGHPYQYILKQLFGNR